jgi:hypothetical protein
MATVKCVDCGFLGLRRMDSQELIGAGEKYRREGAIHAENGRYVFHEGPVCSVGAADFSVFIADREGGYGQAKSERSCASFFVWRPALTPKEHYDMILSKEILEAQQKRDDADREWRKTEADRQREWQAQESRLAAERHEQSLAVALKSSSGNVWATLLAGVLGAIGAIAAVLVSRLFGGH